MVLPTCLAFWNNRWKNAKALTKGMLILMGQFATFGNVRGRSLFRAAYKYSTHKYIYINVTKEMRGLSWELLHCRLLLSCQKKRVYREHLHMFRIALVKQEEEYRMIADVSAIFSWVDECHKCWSFFFFSSVHLQHYEDFWCMLGYFGASIIHRTLIWTTGSLTCACHLLASVYTQDLGL